MGERGQGVFELVDNTIDDHAADTLPALYQQLDSVEQRMGQLPDLTNGNVYDLERHKLIGEHSRTVDQLRKLQQWCTQRGLLSEAT